MSDKAKIAIATGDPAGIGPEISLKAALDPAVREVCHPIVVSDPGVIARHAEASGVAPAIRVIERIADADWSDNRLHVLACAQPEAATLHFGTTSAAGGRASLAFARVAIDAALCGDADAVVAAPQNETAIARAGIKFDGYPSFVARATGSDETDAHLMLCFGGVKIVHATLHRSVRDAIDLITRERILRVIRAADRALERLGHGGGEDRCGRPQPARRRRRSVRPRGDRDHQAGDRRRNSRGIDASGPFGADIMFHMQGIDAFVVMLHDQGHIAAKLMARNAVAALTIGTPILFSSV